MILETLYGDDDDNDDNDRPTQFVHSDKLGALERQLYGHVLATIDLDKLHGLEEQTALLLIEDQDLSDELAMDLSRHMIEAALRRMIEDPRRTISIGAPHGVTPEEKAAVAFDEECQFCLSDRQDAIARKQAEANPSPDEPCPCCDMLVQDWRERHKDKLAKAGLSNPQDKRHKPSPPRRGGRIEVS